MTLRKTTALTALLAFLLEMLTSVILYIVPAGRVAYWADWRLWGLTKTQWGNLHVNLGVLLLLAISLHIWLNWTPIIAYLQNRARSFRFFSADCNAAILLCLLFGLGTSFELPPFSSIVSLGEAIKEQAAREYGEPPYGHAELSSLRTFSKKVEIDLGQAMTRLREAGITVTSPEQTVADLARANRRSPKEIHRIMQPAAQAGAGKPLPLDPPPGFGKRPLADICHEYALNSKIILRGLTDRQLKATEAMTIKEIAAANNTSPMEIFELLREVAGTQRP
ncbi:MAG: DUF4405 domain-containing protein [Thermodesulfobacteriota bacterium]